MKRCTKCGETKELGEFYNRKNSSDGKTSRCKECDNKKNRKWAVEHNIQTRKYGRDSHYANYHGRRSKVLKYLSQWREENQERIAKRNEKLRQATADKHAERYYTQESEIAYDT